MMLFWWCPVNVKINQIICASLYTNFRIFQLQDVVDATHQNVLDVFLWIKDDPVAKRQIWRRISHLATPYVIAPNFRNVAL